MLPLNENKTHEYIDRLLSEGKEDEAIQLIEEVRKKEAQAEKDTGSNLASSFRTYMGA